MDTKFQTSFIPKKPILAEQGTVKVGSRTSVLMFVAVLLFIISISSAGFLVLWKKKLQKDQETYAQELKKAEERFGTETIENLKKANTKIDLAKTFLKDHLAVSEIFDIIGALTIEGVRFESFDFSAPAKPGEGAKISMKGVGNNFSSIAFQSDVFGKSEKFGRNKVLTDPILSDLTLDEGGGVSFSFSAMINSADLSYEKTLPGAQEGAAAEGADAASGSDKPAQ